MEKIYSQSFLPRRRHTLKDYYTLRELQALQEQKNNCGLNTINSQTKAIFVIHQYIYIYYLFCCTHEYKFHYPYLSSGKWKIMLNISYRDRTKSGKERTQRFTNQKTEVDLGRVRHRLRDNRLTWSNTS